YSVERYHRRSSPTARSSDLRALELHVRVHHPHARSAADLETFREHDRRRRAVALLVVLREIEDAAGAAQDVGREVGHGAERRVRSEEHTSELQSRENLVCRL